MIGNWLSDERKPGRKETYCLFEMSEICQFSLVLPVIVTAVVCNHSVHHEESHLCSLFL